MSEEVLASTCMEKLQRHRCLLFYLIMSNNDVTIRVIKTLNELYSMSSEWNTLLQNSRSSSFFLSWEWLTSWAECFIRDNREFFILTFYKNDKLIGIAPLYFEKRRFMFFQKKTLHMLGTPDAGSDHTDVIILKGREKDVASAFYLFLTKDSAEPWDLVSLVNISSDSVFLQHFLSCTEEAGKYVELSRSGYCPILDLPDSESGLYSMMSKSWRKKFKQDMRVTCRDYDVSHETFDGPDLAQNLDVFIEHYQKKSGWSNHRLMALLKKLVEKNESNSNIRIDFLRIDGQLAAALLHFTYDQTLAMYLMAVDKTFNTKISFGNVIVGRTIIQAIAAHYKTYDFLNGLEAYKLHWATSGYQTVRIRFWNKSLLGAYSALFNLAKKAGKALLR